MYQNDIHTCHADCQNPICIEARKSVKAFPSRNADEGMDLRDYFAAKAMQGILSNPMTLSTGKFHEENVDVCYQIADAMMKARGQ